MSITVSTLLWVWIGGALGSLIGYFIGTTELKTAVTQVIAPAAVILAAYISQKITT